jgi:hypothetical protein
MSGAVGGSASSIDGRFAVILHVSTERTLVNFSIVGAVKRHPEMFQFIHHFRRGAAHIFNRILVAQIVRPFDGVVHMPVPIVFFHIAERSGNTTLRRHRMRTRWKYFGEHGDF